MQGSSGISRRLVGLLLGLLLSSTIGWLAYRRKSLTRSGMVGATVTGTTTFGLGGWRWGLALVFFFISSSLFSHFRAREKAAVAADKFSKDGQRDIAQVAANGGVATLLALGYGASTSPALRDTLEAGYVGALATATADTWATELGVLSPHPPRLLTTGKVTSPGTSGGVTPLGSMAAATGAASLGLLSWLLQKFSKGHVYQGDHQRAGEQGDRKGSPVQWLTKRSRSGSRTIAGAILYGRPAPRPALSLPLIALISGFCGSIFDSFLGATVQAMYCCPTCGKETERRVHSCGTPTRPLRGVAWVNNDVVNFLATLCGAVVAMLLHRWNRREQ